MQMLDRLLLFHPFIGFLQCSCVSEFIRRIPLNSSRDYKKFLKLVCRGTQKESLIFGILNRYNRDHTIQQIRADVSNLKAVIRNVLLFKPAIRRIFNIQFSFQRIKKKKIIKLISIFKFRYSCLKPSSLCLSEGQGDLV